PRRARVDRQRAGGDEAARHGRRHGHLHRPPRETRAGARASMIVGRLAPSPTGSLHLGNARTFLWAWLSVRARGGRVLMRVEDLDTPRVKPGVVDRMLDDLRCL